MLMIKSSNARKEGVTSQALVNRQIEKMYADLDKLHILRPDVAPKATEHMHEMQQMIQTLIDKEHAYVSDSGDVLFHVASYANYGALSRQNLDQLQAGARVEVDTTKRHPMDFVLWKMSKPGEPSWDSPWGTGRPGWHIECSAMNQKHLGEHFDIHGGGSDLSFPHHENEIAQSCCASGSKYVNTWMHSGMVMVDQEKMSKSLGNFFTIEDVLKHYDAETLRYFLLASHYRSQVNYTAENLQQAKASVTRLYGALRDLDLSAEAAVCPAYQDAFYKAMNDDFNTPVAYSVLFDMAKEILALKQTDKMAASQAWCKYESIGRYFRFIANRCECFFPRR